MPGSPPRVVSLAPSATEIVFALGCGDTLVGRTAFCDTPEAAKLVPALGGWTTANVDAVVALHPDLVLTSTFLQERIVSALRERGVRVCHTDPRTFADVLASFEDIGRELGVPQRGREVRARVAAAMVSRATARSAAPLRVYAEEWHDPPMASGNWVPDLLRLAGADTLLAPGERSRAVSLEEVRAFAPEVIVLNYCGMGTHARPAVLRQRPGWYDLPAVRQGRLHVIDDSLLNRPGPRLREGFLQLRGIVEYARTSSIVPSA